MNDFGLLLFAILCGVIGVPMLIHALYQEFSGKDRYTPRAKYQRGK